MGQVEGKVALVTGGASGIGRAASECLAREGAVVVLTDIDAGEGGRVAAGIAAAGGRARFLALDVTDEDAWGRTIADVEAHEGRLDVLLANAGIAIMVPLERMSLADFRRQNAINVDGVFLAVKHAIPAMRRSGGGSIIVTSSIAGLRGNAGGLGAYSAGKAAVRMLAKSAALECARNGDPIRVNSIHPGIIDTAIWAKMQPDAAGRRNALDPVARAAAAAPMRRVGTPEDIANGILFLASDASAYMTGAELVIDGGITAG